LSDGACAPKPAVAALAKPGDLNRKFWRGRKFTLIQLRRTP
jgi:hypothetical protein